MNKINIKYLLIIFLLLIIILLFINNNNLFEGNIKTNYPLTCVSTYFPIKNKHNNDYNDWFKNTLSINCPYVFFTNKDTIDLIKKYRKNLPTYYILCEINDFYTYKYRDKMITDPTHCPSIDLNLIWNEKIFMIQKAYEIIPFNSEWFMWMDAGICIFRDIKPPEKEFPNKNILDKLPKDKFIYSSSEEYNEKLVSITNYYHHISGTFILHKNIIDKYVDIYKLYLEKLIDKNNIWTDQVIFTHIYKDYPNLYYKLCNGYGEITNVLYN